MYWPRITQDVTNEISNCLISMKYRANNPAEPILPHPVPERPYQKVGADLFVCDGKDYIVVTDYRHSVPNEVFTDNGPQFLNMQFKCFTEE